MTATTAERTLADFTTDLKLCDIPDNVLWHAKGLLLDQLGIQLACRELPWVRQLRSYVEDTAKAGTVRAAGRGAGADGQSASRRSR